MELSEHTNHFGSSIFDQCLPVHLSNNRIDFTNNG